jgi:peptide/nickel transport system substrate-binding protein
MNARRNRRLGLNGLVIALSLLWTACGPATPQTVVQTVEVPVEVPVEVTKEVIREVEVTAVPPEVPKEKIVIALPADIDTLDPQAFKSIPGYYAIQNLYDQLLDYELEAYGDHWYTTEGIRGMMADEWEVSEDGKTITFHLREGLKFANGNPLTAEDVVYTFDRALKGGAYTAILLGMMTISDLATQVEAVDQQTVVFHLKEASPMMLKLLVLNVVSVLDKETLDSHATTDDPWANEWMKTNTVESGPYVLKSWTPGVGWELEPNPNYWNASAVRNVGIIIKQVDDAQTRLALLKSGAVDVAYDIPYKDLADLVKDPNVQVVTRASTWNFYLGMTNAIPPFDNVKVRQAISYALPYDTIIKDVLNGFAVPSLGPIVPNMPTHDPSLWKYQTDLAKAKQLLAEAGYPDGFKTDLNVLVGRQEDEEAAVWIQASLAQIGVDVTINKMAAAQWYEKFNNKQHPMFMGEWFSWVNDPFYHMTWNFRSDSVFTNAVGYNNPEVDKIILANLYEPDLAKREAASKEAQQMILDDAPWGFLYARNFVVTVRRGVTGYAIYWDQNPRWMYLSKTP